MKKEDFRVGNYLQDAKGRLCQIDALGTDWNDDGIEATAIDGPLTTKPVEPIPLTAEWLENLGFNRDYDSDSGWRKNILREWIYLYCDTRGYFEISVAKHSCPVKLTHVHQLQNLYFALTGEELTIKEVQK